MCASPFFTRWCASSIQGRAFPDFCPIMLTHLFLWGSPLSYLLRQSSPWLMVLLIYCSRCGGIWKSRALTWDRLRTHVIANFICSVRQFILWGLGRLTWIKNIQSQGHVIHGKSMFFHRGIWITTAEVSSSSVNLSGAQKHNPRTIPYSVKTVITRFMFTWSSHKHTDLSSHNSIQHVLSELISQLSNTSRNNATCCGNLIYENEISL